MPYAYYGGAWPVNPPAFGLGYAGNWSRQQELVTLRGYTDMLRRQLEEINSRITELESQDAE
jgi:hypothetical protein